MENKNWLYYDILHTQDEVNALIERLKRNHKHLVEIVRMHGVYVVSYY